MYFLKHIISSLTEGRENACINSTVNYGYETQISAVSAIDRDLKRVEDKADKAFEQVIRHEEKIECLSSKVNCKDCDQKLEKHKKNPHAHQELFDRKVNKQEGYGLISDAELEQIDRNQQDIAVLDGRITAGEERIEKTYTQDEVDELLREQRQKIDEELSHKVDGNWTIICGMEKLGLDRTVATIDDIVNAMPNACLFTDMIYEGDNPSQYPWEYGTLLIYRVNDVRVRIDFCSTGGTFWSGVYYDREGRGFSGWKKYITEDIAVSAVAELTKAMAMLQEGK